jgi:hypothetical protein
VDTSATELGRLGRSVCLGSDSPMDDSLERQIPFAMEFDEILSSKSLHRPTEKLGRAPMEETQPDQLNETYELIEEQLDSQFAEELKEANSNGGRDSWMEIVPLQLRKELTFKRGYMKGNVIDSNA